MALGSAFTKLRPGAQGVLLMSMGGRLGRKLVGRIPVTLVYLSNIVYGMAVLANLLGCLWLFTARCEGVENSWLAHVGMPVCHSLLLRRLSLCPSHTRAWLLILHVASMCRGRRGHVGSVWTSAVYHGCALCHDHHGYRRCGHILLPLLHAQHQCAD